MTLLDEKVFYGIKKRPRNNFSNSFRVFQNPYDKSMVLKISDRICENYNDLEQLTYDKKKKTKPKDGVINRFLKILPFVNVEESNDKDTFTYTVCVNTLEYLGKCSKADKMQANAEMSKSLIIAYSVILFIYMVSEYGSWKIEKIILLVIVIAILIIRARRYDIYRVRNVIRTYNVYQKDLFK